MPPSGSPLKVVQAPDVLNCCYSSDTLRYTFYRFRPQRIAGSPHLIQLLRELFKSEETEVITYETARDDACNDDGV